MNFKRIIFFSILLTIITLVGCSNQGYDDAMGYGMKAVDDEQFKDALDYFEEALKEKPEDDKATTAIEQVKLIIKSVEVAIEEMPEAISLLEKATKEKQDSDAITNKAKEILNNIESMDKQLQKIDDSINKKDFEEALELIDESLDKNDGKVYMLPFEKQLTSFEEDVKKAELFTYIEGYSSNDKEGMEVCQITEDDLMCGVISVDLVSYEEIKSIELQSDDTLKLELVDESDLLISNINENSYDMHDRTFKKTTAKHIENHPANYYQTIDDFFNREVFRNLLENALGNHDLFDFWRRGQSSLGANADEGIKDDEQSKLDNYSDEEIEYARIWLDFINGPTPPQLSVLSNKEGALINPYLEGESIVYPEDVTVLMGESMADGLITYSSNGDGTINVYDVPAHWHQQSNAEMKEATENVLKTIKKKEVPTGNDDQVLNILENMIIEK